MPKFVSVAQRDIKKKKIMNDSFYFYISIVSVMLGSVRPHSTCLNADGI